MSPWQRPTWVALVVFVALDARVASAGSAPFGASCATGTDCASSWCIPGPGEAPDAAGRCTVTCFDDLGCPAGWTCTSAPGNTGPSTYFVCAPEPGVDELGKPCTSDQGCLSGHCDAGSGTCTLACTYDCPSGWSCHASGAGAERMFLCRPGGSGPTPTDFGEACASATGADCESGLCVANWKVSECSRLCKDEDECPSGWVCQALLAKAPAYARACLLVEVGPEPFGGACSAHSDCQSGYCLDAGAQGACTRLCDAGCPAGWGCGEMANRPNASVCVPTHREAPSADAGEADAGDAVDAPEDTVALTSAPQPASGCAVGSDRPSGAVGLVLAFAVAMPLGLLAARRREGTR